MDLVVILLIILGWAILGSVLGPRIGRYCGSVAQKRRTQ